MNKEIYTEQPDQEYQAYSMRREAYQKNCKHEETRLVVSKEGDAWTICANPRCGYELSETEIEERKEVKTND